MMLICQRTSSEMIQPSSRCLNRYALYVFVCVCMWSVARMSSGAWWENKSRRNIKCLVHTCPNTIHQILRLRWSKKTTLFYVLQWLNQTSVLRLLPNSFMICLNFEDMTIWIRESTHVIPFFLAWSYGISSTLALKGVLLRCTFTHTLAHIHTRTRTRTHRHTDRRKIRSTTFTRISDQKSADLWFLGNCGESGRVELSPITHTQTITHTQSHTPTPTQAQTHNQVSEKQIGLNCKKF